ncbi:alpha-(1,3)-fucosyltransferase C-like isoform X1 [Pectinophora gossypiella]|uniref:alpha-(1,3)-fucosyltransferase C-like isoform X1 n=1 Tax=Pectinophora gossypiella TaxID=13191 RepID=UPI00214E969F|nr:alpha-(1,3)-fucosyltransferase C-like isoform X1 [Pectinophora gossypiella]
MPLYLPGGTTLIQYFSRFFSNNSIIFICLILCASVESDENATEVTLQTLVRNTRNTHLIYILLWMDQHPTWINWTTEQRSFINDKCSKTNCFLTYNRDLFRDIRKFQAVIFHGSFLNVPVVVHKRKPNGSPTSYKVTKPELRSPHQKYIFFNMESSANYPVVNDIFDDFFNWTMTYKFDSDIFHPYFVIKNSFGEIVGPKRNITWVADMEDIDEHLAQKLRTKTKAVAWFVSNCAAGSKRDEFVKRLTKSLNKYNLTVDVYGQCGPLQCPLSEEHRCYAMLENDYYFYLALENSFSDDYVTEKILTAVQNNVVPIVYGCADYTRFLPPESYIDGRDHTSSDLADLMYQLIRTPKKYHQYFKWKNYYTYHNNLDNICALCEALNNRKRLRTRVYKQFRSWWNFGSDATCRRPDHHL